MKHLVSLFCAFFLFSSVIVAQEPDWNQFRGPNRDNHSFSTGIAKSWPEGGPRLLWRIDTLGGGYSNLSFVGDTIFTMGDFDGRAFVLALDKANGEIKWRTDIGRGGRMAGHATPQCTPASDGESVFVMGPHGDFVALNASDGTIRWSKNVREEFGARVMGGWGFAMSPLLDGDRVVLPIGGDGGLVIAFDKDGNVLWRTTGLSDYAAYTSVVPVEIEGVRQYLVLSHHYLAGISPTDGTVLWRAAFPGRIAVCTDPVINGDVILASAAIRYNVGSYFYRISREGGNFQTDMFHGSDQRLANHHGGIVAVGNYFYFMTDNDMVCVEASTARVVWAHAWNGRHSKGALQYVDGMLILRSESGDGTVAMIEATPEGYRELGRFDQPDRSDLNSWTYPVVVGNRLYIRDQNVLLVYDLN